MIKHYSEPKIRTRSYNLSKRWYVEFYCINPRTGKRERCQYHCGVNRIQNKKERLSALKEWRDSYSELLFSGWNPLSNEPMPLPGLATNKQTVPALPAFKEVQELKAKKSPDTVRSYKSIVKLFQDWLKEEFLAGLENLVCITKQTMRDYSRYLVAKRQYAPKTHNNHISVLSNFFDEFIFMDLVESNPCVGVKLLSIDEVSQVHKAFPKETVQRITEYLTVNDPELLLFQKFIYYCAIRPKELRLLKVCNIDMSKGTVTVPGAIAKAGQTRTIAIPVVFLEELQTFEFQKCLPDYYLFSLGGAPGLMPYSKDVMNRRFAKVRKALGLPSGYTNYGFKHTAADALFDLPEQFDKAIQQHFRHASLDQTLKYARNRGKRLNEELREKFPKL